MWIDSHAHPHYKYDDFSTDWELLIKNACNNQIKKIMCVATELDQIETLKNIKATFQSDPNIQVDISIGQHPLSALISYDDLSLLIDEKISALGETGFDFQGCFKTQQHNFEIHANLAMQHNLPLILHTRGPVDDLVKENLKKWPKVKGVFHCFAMSSKMAEFAIEQGFYISFSGILTFKNAKELQEIAKFVPDENLLIETDSPFLSPEPFRGKKNVIENVKHVGEYLAKLRNIEDQSLASLLSKNYDNLFGKKIMENNGNQEK